DRRPVRRDLRHAASRSGPVLDLRAGPEDRPLGPACLSPCPAAVPAGREPGGPAGDRPSLRLFLVLSPLAPHRSARVARHEREPAASFLLTVSGLGSRGSWPKRWTRPPDGFRGRARCPPASGPWPARDRPRRRASDPGSVPAAARRSTAAALVRGPQGRPPCG